MGLVDFLLLQFRYFPLHSLSLLFTCILPAMNKTEPGSNQGLITGISFPFCDEHSFGKSRQLEGGYFPSLLLIYFPANITGKSPSSWAIRIAAGASDDDSSNQ